ncbi:MAG: serine/threonine protein kinase [Deltaproteobacteria bacterium]|nr:serine/threonine protein kinase [Deltaproteobacteria bacterium]
MGFTDKIQVILPGKGETTLLPRDHLATGGEGAVYLKNGLVFKLYLDSVAARARGMEEKIRLLARIRHPYIVAPIDILRDPRHDMVGYYMPAAQGAPLVKIFTNAWRDVNGFGNAEAAKLVENMRLVIEEAHQLSALVVDGNEMNWLADGVEPRAIDVDSWQIGPFKTNAIMASIFDHHANTLSSESDWFSWGIVTFQVFTGIHPYKGTHPDFKRGDMEARMRANASVFDSKVKLNAAVRDFSLIPKPLVDWYEGVFQHGDRGAPPGVMMSAPPAAVARIFRARVSGSGLLKHQLVLTLPGPIRHVSRNGIALYEEGSRLCAYDLKRRQPLPSLQADAVDRLVKNEACLVRSGNGFVLLELDGSGVSGSIVTGVRDPAPANPDIGSLPCVAEKLIAWGDRVFALNSHNELGFTEIAIEALGARTIISIKQSWPVNFLSTRFFDGFAVTDCLGTPFVVQPDGDSALLIHRAAALREYHLVNGYAGNRHSLILHGVRRADGRLYRLKMKMGVTEYEVIDSVVVDDAELDIAITPKGIAVAIFDDGEVSVWNILGTGEKIVPDPAVTRDMRLFALTDGVFYYTGRDVFRLSLS